MNTVDAAKGARPAPAMIDRSELSLENGHRASSADPLLSVIVPVRDNTAGIDELIRCLVEQTVRPHQFELVIGDDGSEAGSLDAFASDNDWVQIASGPPQTSYAARNRAARVARGRFLAFCDSDCLPESAWLERGLTALEQADIVAGEIAFLPPREPTVWSLLTMDMFLDQERNVLLGRGVTANLFVRRPVFEALGGFDDTLPSGGDYDFVRRSVESGARLAYEPTAVVRHPTLDDHRSFVRKVWTTNRWAAARRARAEGRVSLGSILAFVPFLGVVRARRNALRPVLNLNRPRLVAAGVEPGWRHDLRAMPVLYLLVAYIAGIARVRGWREGRQLSRQVYPSSRRDERSRTEVA